MVLEVDPVKRRISLGLKQTQNNPWDAFLANYPPGATVEGEVKNATEFGLFIGLEGDVDGMVHLSDLSWDESGEEALKNFERGQIIQAKVLDVDVEKERISLGLKQLGTDPLEAAAAGGELRRGATVTCTVTAVNDDGLEVEISDGLKAFIRRNDLARDRADQRPDKYSVGDKVDARITQFDKAARKVSVSIKSLEIAEEREAVSQFGSSDSGATLGDILGSALKQRDDESEG